MGKFYPSQPKNKRTAIDSGFLALKSFENVKITDLNPLHEVKKSEVLKEFENYKTRLLDSWINHNANVNSENSIMQYSHFIQQRLSYQECAALATDDIINSAINTISNECIAMWGKIVNCDDSLIEILENRLKELNFKNVLKSAISKSLIYGGVGIFFNIGGNQDLKKDLILSKDVLTKNKLLNLKVIEPWNLAPSITDTQNPLSDFYMKPKEWHISGYGGEVSASRIYSLVFFETPDLFKPLYNYFGLSLCSFMRDKVKCADTIRQSLSDLFLRFKTDIIKTPAMQQTNADQIKKRIQLLNLSKNNLGTLLLSENETWEQSITSLAGLDKLQSQAYEAIASSARLPAIKLLGLTPSGFNATGEFDLLNYYDTIAGYQNGVIKDFIQKVLRLLALESGVDIYPEFEFYPLQKENKLENANIKSINSDFVNKLIDSGIISQEQGLKILQNENLIDKSLEFENDLDNDLDLE